MVESPTNPRMRICDIKAISDLAHEVGAIVCVDNTIMSPPFQVGHGRQVSGCVLGREGHRGMGCGLRECCMSVHNAIMTPLFQVMRT
eukprot:scaffold11846_cov25-Tisochrysis_lutea.AAC.1